MLRSVNVGVCDVAVGLDPTIGRSVRSSIPLGRSLPELGLVPQSASLL